MSEEKFNLKYNPLIRNVNSNHKSVKTSSAKPSNIKVTVTTRIIQITIMTTQSLIFRINLTLYQLQVNLKHIE
jgi:hypothetical protein